MTLLFLKGHDSNWQDQGTLPEPKRALDMRWPGVKTSPNAGAPFWTMTNQPHQIRQMPREEAHYIYGSRKKGHGHSYVTAEE
ncbi:hypothetical protein J1605_022276 [Eschrichtius robustus]|uniref:Uncharacterized protein n=1 Tax=Eschrichtius robustus TaxID=9764 RepID=A0AB34HBK8_ESCRO|nr:hypothetical protein J1605_022276 [Eschrichtius robustus]